MKNNPEEEKKKNSAHAQLMAFHAANLVGPIPDAGAQGSAIKFLLEHYTPADCERVYTALGQDEFWHKVGVTWLIVRKEIGGWLKRESEPQATSSQSAKAAKVMPWAGRMYAVGDVISDTGDRYTVMGDDGTPSKRWRDAEAFAKDTGRDVDEVRAKWN